ncbi:hypothetical protein ACFO25_01945 [Paenactinomyces guangxiensis]|uniref:Essential protein Yae1 N-terminal domain-containing protein n=1 Tax=Paenactinomyces guangxiensis TaxID=1490290 RepID=A0A7W1WS21_9BACL|nr:hypothetical protein [Paenactinomyces guangxiensis]MBA4494991.1 hypothetical protein [Paenactinomyces guangxiensis]MBH8592074.1 hypothetical protein [Paenactinomyces guangxiensis]
MGPMQMMAFLGAALFFFLYGFEMGRRKGRHEKMEDLKEFWYHKGFEAGRKTGFKEGNQSGVDLAVSIEDIMSKTQKWKTYYFIL